MASVPAKTRKAHVPTVAFLAHVDTAPDCSGKGVKPIVHRKYNGSVIRFPDNPGLTLHPTTSPELRTALSKDIVTASGTTLLGADDKSGVAVIMSLVERLLRETTRKHGLIRVCFTPDEEIGRGVSKLDLRVLGADVACTLITSYAAAHRWLAPTTSASSRWHWPTPGRGSICLRFRCQ